MQCESAAVVFADAYGDVGLQKTAQPVSNPFDFRGQPIRRSRSTGSLPDPWFSESTDASLDLSYGQPVLYDLESQSRYHLRILEPKQHLRVSHRQLPVL